MTKYSKGHGHHFSNEFHSGAWAQRGNHNALHHHLKQELKAKRSRIESSQNHRKKHKWETENDEAMMDQGHGIILYRYQFKKKHRIPRFIADIPSQVDINVNAAHISIPEGQQFFQQLDQSYLFNNPFGIGWVNNYIQTASATQSVNQFAEFVTQEYTFTNTSSMPVTFIFYQFTPKKSTFDSFDQAVNAGLTQKFANILTAQRLAQIPGQQVNYSQVLYSEYHTLIRRKCFIQPQETVRIVIYHEYKRLFKTLIENIIIPANAVAAGDPAADTIAYYKQYKNWSLVNAIEVWGVPVHNTLGSTVSTSRGGLDYVVSVKYKYRTPAAVISGGAVRGPIYTASCNLPGWGPNATMAQEVAMQEDTGADMNVIDK